MDTYILNAQDVLTTLKETWNKFVLDEPTNLLGLDATSTFEWFESIVSAFPEASNPSVLVARDGDHISGLLPIVVGKSDLFGTKLIVPTELNGGRNGPLIANEHPTAFCNLLDNLQQLSPDWYSLQLTLVSASHNESQVIESCQSGNYPLFSGPSRISPFFPLLENQDALLKNMSKSVRQLLRTSRNKFEAEGLLELREYTDASTAQELIRTILAIDSKSWKHKAGSAITNRPREESFYRELFPRAMENNLLHAQVLLSNGNPVAYNFGLRHNGVFSCLKQSHDEAFDKFSPSYLVNLALIENLHKHNVLTYDFMGKVEPHKLRWSSSIGYYERRTYLIFNNTVRGRLKFNAHRLKEFAKRCKSSVLSAKLGNEI